MFTTLIKTKYPKNVNRVITYTNQKYPNQPLFQLYIVSYNDVSRKEGNKSTVCLSRGSITITI